MNLAEFLVYASLAVILAMSIQGICWLLGIIDPGTRYQTWEQFQIEKAKRHARQAKRVSSKNNGLSPREPKLSWL